MESPKKLVVNDPKEEEQEAMVSGSKRRVEIPEKLVVNQLKEGAGG